jgi:hypothetical protein
LWERQIKPVETNDDEPEQREEQDEKEKENLEK